MRTSTMRDLLAGQAVFAALEPDDLDLLAGCARNEHFYAGDAIFSEGDPADKIYILRGGDIAVEISNPQTKPLIVETLHDGEVEWVVERTGDRWLISGIDSQ